MMKEKEKFFFRSRWLFDCVSPAVVFVCGLTRMPRALGRCVCPRWTGPVVSTWAPPRTRRSALWLLPRSPSTWPPAMIERPRPTPFKCFRFIGYELRVVTFDFEFVPKVLLWFEISSNLRVNFDIRIHHVCQSAVSEFLRNFCLWFFNEKWTKIWKKKIKA